jgi:hypothetical protein
MVRPIASPAVLAYLSDEWLAALQASADGDDRLREATKGTALVIEQHVTDGPRGTVVFHVDIHDGTVTFAAGPAPDADVTFTQPYEVAAGIARNELSAQAAFAVGRISVDGRVDRLHAEATSLGQLDDVFASVRSRTEF